MRIMTIGIHTGFDPGVGGGGDIKQKNLRIHTRGS